MVAWLNVCRYTPTSGGTTDWTYAAAVTGYQGPTAAGVVNSSVYRYRAESADLSQWEMGYGAYNTATNVLARTTVLFNSSGTGTGAGQTGAGSKINFTTVPQVAIVALAEDMSGFVLDVGDTMTGDLTLNKNDGAFILNSAASSDTIFPKLRYTVNGLDRWQISALWGVESGSNSGSALSIDRFDDTGAYIDSPVSFLRETGIAYFNTVSLNKNASGLHSPIIGQTVGSLRWQLSLGDSVAESGSNLGSNFGLFRYTDAGAFLGTPLYINRATGLASFETGLTVTSGNLTVGAGNLYCVGDITTYRSATPTTGVIFLNSASTKYLFNDGSLYNLPAQGLDVGGEITWVGAAWTSYGTSISSLTGTFTSASATLFYKKYGKTLFIRGSATITTVGTGGIPVLTLPFSCVAGNLSGRETAVAGFMVNGTLQTASSFQIYKYDGTAPAANGHVYNFSGTFELT